MQYLREGSSDEERVKAARQLRAEALVWAKVLIEHSPAAGRADPLAVIRQAFADGVDEQWNGRMFDLVTFGGGSIHASLRLSCSMLVGPTVRSLLRRPVSGGGSAFSAPLRQAAGARAVGPDLIVILGNARLALPKQLPKGALRSKFLIGSLGEEPSDSLMRLATNSGGPAMALRDESDAKFFASLFCKAFLSLASVGGGQVSDPSEAAQHFDAAGSASLGYTAYGYSIEQPYAFGENDSPHGLSDLEHRERRHDSPGSGYGGRYGYGYADDREDDF